jgi:hypothetical protein
MNIDHENTVRALRGDAPIATHQWWCRLGLHTWLMWTEPKMTRRGVYNYIEQYRACACCGKASRRLMSKD